MIQPEFKLRARWIVWGDFDPAAFAAEAPVPTGGVWRKGDVRRVDQASGEAKRHDDYGWLSEWTVWRGWGLEDLVDHLLTRIESAPRGCLAPIVAGAAESQLCVVLTLITCNEHVAHTPSVSLTASLMQRMAQCHVSLDVDLYVREDDA